MKKLNKPEEGKEARRLLAQNLRQQRGKKNISQDQLAHDAGVNKNYISEIENESRAVSIDIVEKMARALGVSVAAMFEDN